jgi:hypothetical protein
MSLYKRAFATFYTNAASTSGNCKVTCSALSLSTADGTLTYRKGFPNIKWTSDDGATNVYFSLRDMTNNLVSRGAHLLTFTKGRSV